MRVLVTGSSGFIGKHVINTVSDYGFNVIGLDIQNNQPHSEYYTFKRCDILDSQRLFNIFSAYAPQVVIHLAARTDLKGKSLDDYSANIAGINNVISAVEKTSSVKRCIYTSSQLVCKIGYIPKTDDDYMPDTLYGESKVLSEKMIRQRNGGNKIWCIVRPTTIWGPGMSSHYQTLFKLIYKGLYFHVTKKPLYKSYGYVKNTSYQYLRLLTVAENTIQAKTLYLADYKPLSLRSWIESINHEMNRKPIHTLSFPMAKMLALIGDFGNHLHINIPFNSFRLNNILTEYKYDLTETESIVGPLPFSVDEGIGETVNWLRENVII